MRAAHYDRQGSSHDVLVTGDLPEPQASAGEVRVKVYVSGLEIPPDIKARRGSRRRCLFLGSPLTRMARAS